MQRPGATALDGLADSVEHDDRVVDRVAADGEDRADGDERELASKERECADGDDHVVQQRDDGTDGEAELEPQRDEEEDAQHAEPECEGAALLEFAADERADSLFLADLEFRLGKFFEQRELHLHAGLFLAAHRDVVEAGRAFFALHDDVLQSELLADFAHVAVVRLGAVCLEDNEIAALEINAVVPVAAVGEVAHRADDDREREAEGALAVAEEVDLRALHDGHHPDPIETELLDGPREERAADDERGEERRDDADGERDREALHRTGREKIEHER